MVVNATPDETTAAAPAPSTPPPEFEKLSRENLAFVVALLRRFGVPPSGLREACQRALPEDPCDSFGTGDHRTARRRQLQTELAGRWMVHVFQDWGALGA
jgi:hypothetical protein